MGAKYKSVAKWADSLRDFLTFHEFPEALRKKIYTNNAVEGLGKRPFFGLTTFDAINHVKGYAMISPIS